ncbi:MAG: hypothetical protein JXM73_25255 [Anaerolineae bacterium]|nr:hypothetical protein [Anaerolineae bacterium]
MAEGTSGESQAEWIPWIPPGDPRRIDSATVIEDEHGRLIESADCGIRCPGCGMCCAGYRDRITADYAGVEEFEGNLKLVRGGLLKREDGLWYRIPHCGESCPGFGLCCKPYGMRDRPEMVAEAHRVLLEDEASPLWQQQEALLILAHHGSDEAVRILETFMPRAHVRIAGFAECALDEGRMWADTPRNAEEARVKMKREVLEEWDLRACDAYGRIEEMAAELERLEYAVEIALRLLDKVPDDVSREACQTRVQTLQALAGQAKERLEAEQQEMDWCDAMVAEMQADLGIDPMAEFCGEGDDQEIPF